MTNLEAVEKSVSDFLKCELKWNLAFPPILFPDYCDFDVLKEEDCNGKGFCLCLNRKQNYFRPKAAACLCRPEPCLNCGELNPVEVMETRMGYCILCSLCSQKEFENRRTKINCNLCLKPLDRKYHRLDYKNSPKEWVKNHVHKACLYKWKLELMDDSLDDECDCIGNSDICKH